MQLTTTFGSAQLALQNALLKEIILDVNHSVSPNFLTISLNQDRFAAEYPGDTLQQLRRFKADLTTVANTYIDSNGWRIGGTGSLVINLIIAGIPEDCRVKARVADALYQLAITDADGDRMVAIKRTHVIVGRAHQQHARGFVSINDPERIMSREHLDLTYSDLSLRVKLSGKNLTTLNGNPLGAEPHELSNGDEIICGAWGVRVRDLVT